MYDMTVRTIDRTGAQTLIPAAESAVLLNDYAAKASLVLSNARKLPALSTKITNMPVLSALPSAYFVSGDTGQKQTTKAEWDKVTITAEELAVIVPIPEAVLDDASYPIWEQVRPLIGEAIGVAVDGAVLYGTNKPASWPGAIIPSAIAIGNAVTLGTGDDLAADVSSVMSALEVKGYRARTFSAGPSFEGRLRNLRNAEGDLLYVPSLSAGVPSTLYGKPLSYVENGVWDDTQALLLAGDWSKLVWAPRQDISYKLLTEAVIQDTDGSIIYNLAQQDMVALRVTFRLGIAMAKGLSRIAANSARYPFSVLKAAA